MHQKGKAKDCKREIEDLLQKVILKSIIDYRCCIKQKRGNKNSVRANKVILGESLL